jgi:catechol 2,3-dioxygenase-like lactoylglutathione lyase family enzyme
MHAPRGRRRAGRVMARMPCCRTPCSADIVPRVFDHVTIRVSDREASRRFYATVLATLGIVPTYDEPELVEWDDFSIAPADGDHPATQRLHIGFVAPSRDHIDAFHAAAVTAGYRDDGAPGPRPQYTPDYYGAFLLDPDGNSAEAVHHEDLRQGGNIDHLWIRVADIGTSRAFWEALAPEGGWRVRSIAPDHVQVRGDSGSFSLVAGPPTEHVHMAFPAADDAAVDAFHHAALHAGYRDNGAPGERPQYHPGYYGAFVLDPDGHNIELVNHNR